MPRAGAGAGAGRAWRSFLPTPSHSSPQNTLSKQNERVVSDLGYCASSSVFRKIVIYFCHRSFYCIHHLKDKNRNNPADRFSEAFLENIHLNSRCIKAVVPHGEGRGGEGHVTGIEWVHRTAPTTKNYSAQIVTGAEAEKPRYKPERGHPQVLCLTSWEQLMTIKL